MSCFDLGILNVAITIQFLVYSPRIIFLVPLSCRMCVTFLALANGQKEQLIGGKYKLILLNNRDEMLDRVTSPLNWRDDILACWDEQATEHGTWLGIDRKGRLGVLLSITQPQHTLNLHSPSRGALVTNFLSSTSSPYEYLSEIAEKQEQFNGFQLILIDSPFPVGGTSTFFSLSNRFSSATEAGPIAWPLGVYGFGNSPRHLPFQKVNYGEKLFQQLINEFDFSVYDESKLVQSLFDIASDRTIHFPDEQIRQQTGCPENSDAYTFLCSLFVDGAIEGRNYGTMSSSVILMDLEGSTVFHEKRLIDPKSPMADPTNWRFSEVRFSVDKGS